MSELKLWQSSATEEAKTLRLEAKRRDEDAAAFGREDGITFAKR